MLPTSVVGCAKAILEPMVHLAQTVHLSCVEMNTFSKWTEMSFHLTRVLQMSCAQNDFRAYGTFEANLAPILSRD
jgi:hypothetical protein